MDEIVDIVIKLLLAMLLGGVIGIEREFRDKAAGFRTVILICLGATLFTIISIGFLGKADPARVAAQIVTGVGFLGAGAILRDGGRIVGLTTAALIWMAAAIGMAVGSGHYMLAVATTLMIAIIMWFFPKVEAGIDKMREIRTYEVVFENSEENMSLVKDLFTEPGLHTLHNRWVRRKDNITVSWTVHGTPEAQKKLSEQLLTSRAIKGFSVQE